jgi:hypothetical protein
MKRKFTDIEPLMPGSTTFIPEAASARIVYEMILEELDSGKVMNAVVKHTTPAVTTAAMNSFARVDMVVTTLDNQQSTRTANACAFCVTKVRLLATTWRISPGMHLAGLDISSRCIQNPGWRWDKLSHRQNVARDSIGAGTHQHPLQLLRRLACVLLQLSSERTPRDAEQKSSALVMAIRLSHGLLDRATLQFLKRNAG